MSQNTLFPQKRQIINCNLQSSKSQQHNVNMKKYYSQQDFNEMNKKYEVQKYQSALNNDIMSRVTLLQNQNRNALQDGNQSLQNEDVFGVKTSIQRVKKSSDIQDQPISQSQTSRTYKSTRYDWLKNKDIDLDNNKNQQYSFFGNIQLSSHNNYSNNLGSDKDLTQNNLYKFKSLSNIDPFATKLQNNSQVESVNIVSNKGRYIVHQRVKKTIDQNPLPSTFFTIPQYKTPKAQAYSLQDIPSKLFQQKSKINQNSEVVPRTGLFQSFYNQPKQNQQRYNLKNDNILTQFIPCFSTPQTAKLPPQIPTINQNQTSNSSNNIFSQKNSFHHQVKSSQNLEFVKDNNSNSKIYYQTRSNQNIEDEKKQQKHKLQNELSQKFDNSSIKGKNPQNNFKSNSITKGNNNKYVLSNQQILNINIAISNIQQQNQEERRGSYSLSLSGDQTSTTQEQNDNINETSICKHRNEFSKENTENKYQNDKFRKFSNSNETDELDSSSNQDEGSLKNENMDNILDDNINDEIKSNLNENEDINSKNRQDDSLINKKDLNFMISGNSINATRKFKLFGSKKKRQENSGINTMNSLSFLDEGDQGIQTKLKKYNASSYTKLPSASQLGRIASRKNNHSQNKIKSQQEIPIQKNLSMIDEKKILEDYKQYQIRNKLDIKSKSIAVYDVDNQQLVLSIKGNKLSQIASLTKIMTCYIVCDLLNRTTFKKNDPVKVSLSKTQTIQISKIAAKMKGTSAFLCSGDQLTLWSLLHGLMLPSGNDAAFAISEQIGSIIFESSPIFQAKKHQNTNLQSCNPKEGQKEFINVMNIYAQKMKLKNTNYSNPHGLSNNKNKSCANDLCILVNNAMKNPYFREIVATKEYTAQIINPKKGNRESTWENTQKLLKKNKYCNGVKTGVTPAAGPCLASSFSINNRNFIIVILNTTSMEMRFTETMLIFKFIVENYELDKEQQEDIKKELNYQPDQDDVINANELNEENYYSDENFDDFEEDNQIDDEQNFSKFDNKQLTNNDRKYQNVEQDENQSNGKRNIPQPTDQIKNKTKENQQDQKQNNDDIKNNLNLKSRENQLVHDQQSEKLSSLNKLDQIYPQQQKFQELLRCADKQDDMLNELNYSSKEKINMFEQNCGGQFICDENDQQIRSGRGKKLSKINEENI